MRRSEAVKETKVGAFFGKASQNAGMEASASASLPENTEIAMKEATDFFGRALVQDKSGAGGASMSLEMARPKKTRIWYKFNEGFSNAVKAKVFINELL